ncbi:major facilitator superfamily protein [Planoprotostelium fungivorum]|uniref:Major facilitator superfamily protein n=1 Tax=Planoprotostelium fungivorum TaxID=1890364 RepID=A0A2P6NT06_9EUKA|nr:major facilitator superfamily protein [Planoprotostelium fungivorum]
MTETYEETEEKASKTPAAIRNEGCLKPHLVFVLIPVLLYSISMTLFMAAQPWAILKIFKGDNGAAGEAAGYLLAIVVGTGTITGPMWGRLSSIWGRKICLVIAIISGTCDVIALGFPISYRGLILVKILSGMTNPFFTTVSACIADVTTPENRTMGYSLLWGIFSMSSIGLPILSGWMVKTNRSDLLFQISGCVMLTSLIIVLFTPETMTREVGDNEPSSTFDSQQKPVQFRWNDVNPLYPFRLLVRKPYVAALCVLAFFIFFTLVAPSELALWCNYRWGWDAFKMGIVSSIIATIGLLQVFINAFIAPRMQQRTVVIICIICSCGASSLYTFMPNPYYMIPASFLIAIAGVVTPVFQSMMSREYTQEYQGDISGVFIALKGLVWALGPLSSGILWKQFASTDSKVVFPSINFTISGGVSVLCFFAALVLFYAVGRKEKLDVEEISPKSINQEPVEKTPLLRPQTN